MSSAEPAARARLGLGLCALIALAALLPSLGTFGAGLISEDAAALGYVHRHGAFADWTQPQYGLSSVRFWRPLVSDSLALQEFLSGTAPAPLRWFNALGHAASAWLAALICARLGASRIAAVAVGLLAACFPFQGGNVTWIVGRVDAQCVPLVLLACHASLAGRTRLALLATFGACATKELGFATPLWALALHWGAGRPPRAALRAAAPLLALAALLFVGRRLALGEWAGGYPQAALGARELLSGLRAFGAQQAPELLALLALALLAALACERGEALRRARAALAAVLAALLAAAPLAHVLAPGAVAPEHARTLWLSDMGLLLAAGCLAPLSWPLPRAARARALALCTGVLLLGWCGWRAQSARENVLRWAAAGELARSYSAERARELAPLAPAPEPAFALAVPHLDPSGQAYVLMWGLADRFRAPFEPSPRAVWPWRNVFSVHARAALGAPLGGCVLALHSALDAQQARALAPNGPAWLALACREAGRELAHVQLDERLFEARFEAETAHLSWPAQLPAGALELVLATELGYEPAPWFADAQSAPRSASLRSALLAHVPGGGLALWQVLAQAADVGAEHAYLQVRVRAADAAPLDAPVAASGWLRLEWRPQMRRALQRSLR